MTQTFLAALVAGLLLVVPVWKICAKAGLPAPLSLLVFIPGIGIVAMICILALVHWTPDRGSMKGPP